MIDGKLREALHSTFEGLARSVDHPAISPNLITLLGLVTGLAGALSAWQRSWFLALALWLFSRIADGIDGPLSRRRLSHGAPQNSAGGYLDIMADFTVYGSFVIGVAHGSGGNYLPFIFVLLAYYLNGTSFLAFSSIGEKEGIRIEDDRSLSFIHGIAEATETIIVHSAWCIFPSSAAKIAGVWAGVVLISATLRFLQSKKILEKGVIR